MYEVWKIHTGTIALIDRQRDPLAAQDRAIEESRLHDALYTVMREGFGEPLYFAWRGMIGSAIDTMRRMSAEDVPPVLALVVPPVQAPLNDVPVEVTVESEGEIEDSADTPEDPPKPRRRRREPEETKGKGGKPDVIKQYPTTITAIDEDAGVVEAIVNVFGIIDDGDDIVHQGAFAKTLAENGTRVKVLDSHNNRSSLSVVGRPLDIHEVGREALPPQVLMQYPDATGGLYTKTQYLLNTPEGEGVFKRIKAGALNEYSIGFDALDTDNERVQHGDVTKVIRNIRSVRLWEYSPVVFGMNPATGTVSVKAASGAADLPLADRARAWDARAAEGRVRTWAGGQENMDWPKYRQAFFWYDGENGETFTAYKLGFADVIDGTLTAIPRGIFAVAAALQGSRGGVDIPADDQSAVKGKVATYYARMRSEFDDDGITVPWAAEGAGGKALEPEPVPVFGEWLVQQLMNQCAGMLEGAQWGGLLDEIEYQSIMELCNQHLEQIRAEMPQPIALRPMTAVYILMNHAAEFDTKVGRVLSERNFNKVKQASDLLSEVLSSAGLNEEDTPDQSGKSHEGSDDHAMDGPSGSTHAPTPRDGAGPQENETPATKRADLLKQLAERLATVEEFTL